MVPSILALTTNNNNKPKQQQQPSLPKKSFDNNIKKEKKILLQKLDLKAVCERAKSIPGCRQIYPPPLPSSSSSSSLLSVAAAAAIAVGGRNIKNHNSKTKIYENAMVASFMLDLPATTTTSSNHHPGTTTTTTTPMASSSSSLSSSVLLHRDVVRVNVFCDSGTIAICRVLHGQVRQIFRRNVSSLDVVERLLRYPPELTRIDSSLVERFGNHHNHQNHNNNNDQDHNDHPDHTPDTTTTTTTTSTTWQQDLELAEIGLYILQGEREKLLNHLTALEEQEDPNHGGSGGGSGQPRTKHNTVGYHQQENLEDDDSSDHHRHRHRHPNHHHHPRHHQNNPTATTTTTTTTTTPVLPPPPVVVPKTLDVVAGTEFQFSLPIDTMSQVEQCLEDITTMGKMVRHVATNGKSTIFLYGHGGVAYTSQIPKPLQYRLKKLQKSCSTPDKRPCYISLGSRDRYYVGFYDGTAEWKGPKRLDKLLKTRRIGGGSGGTNHHTTEQPISNPTTSGNHHHHHPKSSSSSRNNHHHHNNNNHHLPQCVAFGKTYDTVFVVFGDGSWVCDGRGIPEDLEDKLADRMDRPDLVCVTLGPKGEWFLRAKNGRMWWGGISTELDQLIQDLLQSGNFLSYIDFGDDGSYFVSYDDTEVADEDDEEDDDDNVDDDDDDDDD